MSGHKKAIIRANADELRAFNQTEMALRYVETGLKDLNQKMDQATEKWQVMSAQQNPSDQEYLQHLSFVDEQLAQLEQDTSNALVIQQTELSEQLITAQHDIGEEFTQNLAWVVQTIRSNISSLDDHYTTQINNLAQHMSLLSEDSLNKQAWLEQWLNLDNGLLSAIYSDQAYPFYDQPRLAFLEQTLNQAEENFQRGFLETALFAAQSAFFELSSLRNHARQMLSECEQLAHLLELELVKLEDRIEQNRKVPILDVQGRVLPQDIDVDEWIDGRLQALSDDVVGAEAVCFPPYSASSLANIHALLESEIPLWNAQVSELVLVARTEVINSQLRMNIARMVVKALANQGYRLESSCYTEDNMRQGYQAHLQDAEGSRVLIKVEPAQQSQDESSLHIFTYDARPRTPHEINQRSLEIKRCLTQSGLHATDLLPVRDDQHHINTIPTSRSHRSSEYQDIRLPYEH